MLLAGIETVSYTSKKDNTLKEGINIFWTEEIPEDKGVGLRCKSEYVRRSVAEEYPKLEIGKSYRLFYNKFGQVDGWIEINN